MFKLFYNVRKKATVNKQYATTTHSIASLFLHTGYHSLWRWGTQPQKHYTSFFQWWQTLSSWWYWALSLFSIVIFTPHLIFSCTDAAHQNNMKMTGHFSILAASLAAPFFLQRHPLLLFYNCVGKLYAFSRLASVKRWQDTLIFRKSHPDKLKC